MSSYFFVALVKIAITTNPEITFPGQRMLELVRPIRKVLKIEHTALENFEALKALTNLASIGESVRKRILKEGEFSTIEQYMFEEHSMLGQAPVECMYNLVVQEEVIKCFTGENDHIKLLALETLAVLSSLQADLEYIKDLNLEDEERKRLNNLIQDNRIICEKIPDAKTNKELATHIVEKELIDILFAIKEVKDDRLVNEKQFTFNSQWSKSVQPKNRLIIFLILFVIIISLTITTITFAVLWNRSKSHSNNEYAVAKGTIDFPIRLPDDGKYIQWTFLQLNDVYEMLPLDQGRKGGLARVARVRQLLLEENRQTYTILSGDFVSPSALSQSKINGTTINGRQMIASLNTLGIDFVTFGNHEFDLNETELIARINESKFSWISSNVFKSGTDLPFSSTSRYKILSIDKIRILLIGLTIDINKSYIRIINQTSLIPFVQQFLKSISNIKYDVLVALTHLDLEIDKQLAENIPQIDLILGGHEHENYFLLRGSEYIPITKADANAFTVYIHRCAFNLNTKRLRVYRTLTQITSELEDEQKTAEIVNYWYNSGIKGFEQIGFQPNKTVSCLPSSIVLDGRSTSVRNFPTLLTDIACQSILYSASMNGTIIGVFNTGSIRVDDVLRGTITQYDILRIFPFQDNIFSLSVPGSYLASVLSRGMSMKGSGTFLAFCGIETLDQGKTWLLNGIDISKTDLNYSVATITYLKDAEFLNPSVTIWWEFNITQTQGLINYLQTKYPPC
ncbi:unnamed protein product [Rotaria sp. Silwood2]|nr:unnamed protein product [Rotaria sp. Silwood2]